MTAPPTRALRWIPADEIGVRFNLSPRLVRDCLGAFKRLANSALNKAVREGRVSRPQNCSECQNGGRIEGHHPNYLRWLEVVWLCRTCHSKQPSGSLPKVPVRYVKRWVVQQRDREERYRCLLKTPQTSTVGSRIAGQRVMLRRTVVDVADKLGMNETVLLLWENDQATPTLREAIRLARELKVSLDYLFEGTGAP